MNIELQPFQPEHYQGFEHLQEISADGGAVSGRTHHLVPLSERIDQNSKGIVAVTDGNVVGAALVSYWQLSFNGTMRPAAYLNSLVVHPEFRGKGIAGRLTRRRIDDARADLGADIVLLANIQSGNTPSVANARRWAKTVVSSYKLATFKPSAKSPDIPYNVKTVADETADIFERINNFKSRHFDVYSPYTLDSFKQWLNHPLGTNQHLLLVDDSGEAKAGISVVENFKTSEFEIVKIPSALRVLNKFVRMIPPDGIMRMLALGDLWYDSPQHGRLLFQHVRHEWYGKANIINVFCDPNGPYPEIYRPRFWESQVSGQIAISEDVPQETRFSIELLA